MGRPDRATTPGQARSAGGLDGDAGEVGVAVNAANFLETGTFWAMEHCEPEDGESADRTQLTAPDITAGQQDALLGAVAQLFGGVLPSVPVYQQPAHCNRRGLTDLGRHTIEGLADRDMIFDPDHLSVRARARSMDIIEDLGHAGVISSHSWSTPDAYPRVYGAGGFITPYAGDADGFVKKWRRHLGWADERHYFGFGFGADINVDGVAQYGLYPDWVEDLRQIADRQNGDGDAIVVPADVGARRRRGAGLLPQPGGADVGGRGA